MLLFSLIMALPVFWMVSAAFKYESEIFDFPIKWIPDYLYLDNFKTVFNDFPYMNWYANTLVVYFFLSLFVHWLLVLLAAYAFARMDFTGKGTIFAIYIATLMIPLEVRIIPQFLVFKELNLINTHMALVLPWLFNGFAIFLLRQFFVSIPFELSEAAKIDGCFRVSNFLYKSFYLSETCFNVLDDYYLYVVLE